MRAVTVVAVLAMVSCKSKEQPPPPPKPAVEGLEVLARGAAPHVPLRYRLAKGTTSTIELAVDADLTTVDGALQLPTLGLTVEVAATDVAADGTATLRTTVTAASARDRAGVPAAAEVMQRQASLLVGLAQTATLSPTGALGDSKIVATHRDLAPPTQEQLATLSQSLQQLAMPLPTEPVGAGATWRFQKTMELNQLKLVAVTTVHVTHIDGDRVGYTTTTELGGADQTFAQGSASAQITKLRGHGAGTATADLAQMTTTGTTSAELAFEMRTEGATRPTSMVIVTRVGPAGSVLAAPAGGSPDGGVPAGDDPDDHGAHNAP